MNRAAWPFSGFYTTRPGKMDLFVLTLIDGEIVRIEGILDYDEAVTRAQALHRERDCQIKVLPVTGQVAFNLFGIEPPEHPEPMDPVLRRRFEKTVSRIARRSVDRGARIDAAELLRTMGVMQP
jgi:hypothetical protein